MISEERLDEYNKRIENIEWLIRFEELRNKYKDKPDVFVEKFFGIKLFTYQKILLRQINKRANIETQAEFSTDFAQLRRRYYKKMENSR